MYSKIAVFVLILTNFVSFGFTANPDDEFVLTYDQKLKLDEFKELVSHKLPNDYMKEEIYLIKWLRASNYDLSSAQKMLMENLRWRKEWKIDTILDEDFSDFEEEYPYYVLGCDFKERFVTFIPSGQWDMRKAIISGKGVRMQKYSYRMWEEAATAIREAQKQGRNVTQYTLVMNMKGFSLQEHACPLCMPLHFAMASEFEKYYPGQVHQTIIINAPQIFVRTFNLVSPVLSADLRKRIHVFGTNKGAWESYLLSQIPKDQLTKELGGTKSKLLIPAELRKTWAHPC